MCKGMPLFLLVSNVAVVVFLHNILCTVIPYLLDDTHRVMEGWGASGKFDPFDNVYEVSVTIHHLLLSYQRLFTFAALIPAYHTQFVVCGDF